MQHLHTDSITGTSTSTPTTTASAAGLVEPKSVMATATANSKKLLAPINAQRVAISFERLLRCSAWPERQAESAPFVEDVVLAVEPDMPEQLPVFHANEDLRGNHHHLDAVLSASGGVLPEVNEIGIASVS